MGRRRVTEGVAAATVGFQTLEPSVAPRWLAHYEIVKEHLAKI